MAVAPLTMLTQSMLPYLYHMLWVKPSLAGESVTVAGDPSVTMEITGVVALGMVGSAIVPDTLPPEI